MASDKPKINRETFISRTLKLLEKERETEIEETRVLTEKLPAKELQRRGVCLLKLHISSRQTGLYGRTVVIFETHLESFPAHSFTPGDIVGLNYSQSAAQSEGLGSGIVTKVGQTALTIAFDEAQDLYSLADGIHDYYKITKLANDVTYKRLKRALGNLDKGQHGDSSYLVDVLFGEAELLPPVDVQDLQFINAGLDESQRDAVVFALSQRDVAVVHGPPGTGKTTTVIEIILQSVKQGNKILACAPSNIAVDNLVERLALGKTRVVRLGHPARLLPHLQKFSLDAILTGSEETQLVEDVRKDLDKALSSLRREKDKGGRQRLKQDIKHYRKELRQREEAATRDILKRAEVVLVTLTSATEDGPLRLLEETHFDVVVIDEVSQSMEAACWIPLLRTRKCILAGDHLQLPPTILSNEAAKEGLAVTLMERVLDLYGDKVMRMLTTQYRMNTRIMQWSSDQLYESKLVAHCTVAEHLLKDLPGVEDNEITSVPLLYIDTAGCDLHELDLPEEISKGNEGEADIVAAHVAQLVQSGLAPDQVAVIAPYNLQVELIRLRLAQNYPKVEVKSVDGFQGREKEAVVISLVRSNPTGEVGFLSERRRINVAVTRARRHLTVVGDSGTVGRDPFLKSLIDYLNAEGEVQTAQEYIDDGVLNDTTVSRPEHLDDLISVARQESNKGAKPKAPRSAKSGNKQAERPRQKQPRHVKDDDIALEKQAQTDSQVEEIQSQLQQFVMNDKVQILEFPTSLTSHGRFLVHELSEKMGLGHSSKGVGEERYIVVTKLSASAPSGDLPTNDPGKQLINKEDTKLVKQDANCQLNEKASNEKLSIEYKVTEPDEGERLKSDNKETIENMAEVSKGTKKADASSNLTDKIGDGKVQCKVCGKHVIKANIDLHEIHCAKKAKQGQSEPFKGNESKKKNVCKSTKPRQFDKELAKKVENIDGDDLDTLLETVKKMDSKCCFKKCKTSVQTLCNVCSFCKGRYCMSHHMPEVHGCGDAAKADARARISKDGVLYRGSGVPNKKPDDTKKAHLQRRLDSKLSDMAAKRKSKPKK